MFDNEPFSSSSRLYLGAVEVVCAPGELLVVDVRVYVHLPGVDLHDAGPRLLRGRRELDLPVQPARPQQRRIQDVDSVGGGDNLVEKWLMSVQLQPSILVVFIP